MLYYDRINNSEETVVNKTSEPKEYDICHYWYFSNTGFKFQPNTFNGYYDLLMMSMKLSDIVIINTKCADYCCLVSGISKIETISLMQNINLIEESET